MKDRPKCQAAEFWRVVKVYLFKAKKEPDQIFEIKSVWSPTVQIYKTLGGLKNLLIGVQVVIMIELGMLARSNCFYGGCIPRGDNWNSIICSERRGLSEN